MPVKSLDIERRLRQLGFNSVHRRGSHKKLKDSAGKTIILPTHQGRDSTMGVIWTINKNLKSWGYEQLNLWN